jgi:putative PIN family toxin of toxin-antitoxin system
LSSAQNKNIIGNMKKRAVLDTNILVAASRSRLGASFAVLRAMRAGQFQALASVPLVLEYEAVLMRAEHLEASNRTAAMTAAFLDAFCLLAEPVELFFLWRPQLRDAADEMVLETALNGRADALVTLNARDFRPATALGIDVLSPSAFLQTLQLENV